MENENFEIETLVKPLYKITLRDGTVLENLELNGNNYISEEELTEETFLGNLAKVKIECDGIVEEHRNMALVQCVAYEGKSWFILRDMTESELKEIKLKADLEYIAMMTGVEL